MVQVELLAMVFNCGSDCSERPPHQLGTVIRLEGGIIKDTEILIYKAKN